MSALLHERMSVEQLFLPLAELFWPELKQMSGQKRLVGAGEVLAFLSSAPLALVGLVWLALVTDPQVLAANWSMLLFLGGLMFLFRKLGFFMIAEIRAGRYASGDGSMESMVLWTAVLLFGPSTLWLAVVWAALDFAWRWQSALSAVDRWSLLRNLAHYLAGSTLAALTALVVYTRLGGQIPIRGLFMQDLLPAFLAMSVYFILQLFVWMGFLIYSIWAQKMLTHSGPTWPVVRFILFAVALPNLALPSAALIAGAYSQNGPGTFLVFMVVMLLVAVLARRLSWAGEISRQKSRQLEKLEMLAHAILAAPPDASTLGEILSEQVPSMFPSGRVAIWTGSRDLLAAHPGDWEPDTAGIWEWLQNQSQPRSFLSQDELPWLPGSENHNPVVIAPIFAVETARPLGGVYLELYNLAQPWDRRSLENLFPAVQALASQVASALHQAETYGQALAYQKVSQELALAGRIQASFLPDVLPDVSGWQLAVTLLPARETSGDYFDLIPLSNGKLGVLIADVTDKGIGAALYMALSRTLIRTYAIEFDDDAQPDVIFFAANNRLLKDARADLFVTAFYGILDPETGELSYCNAGHSSPYLLHPGDEPSLTPLHPSGMPIGIEEDNIWALRTAQVSRGDVLVLYTDGILDAQNLEGEFFGDDRLSEVITAAAGRTADDVQESILKEIVSFGGGAPQYDDITLLVLVRDENQED